MSCHTGRLFLLVGVVLGAALTGATAQTPDTEPPFTDATGVPETAAPEETPSDSGRTLPVPDFSGPLNRRLKLSGDWGGFRTRLAELGIYINVDWYQVYFGGIDGGVNPLGRTREVGRFALTALTGSVGPRDILRLGRTLAEDRRVPDLEYKGGLDYTLLFDTGALGLWKGGLLLFHGETVYGNYPNRDTGVLLPLQLRTAVPENMESITTLSHVVYTQIFTPKFNVSIGKLPGLAIPHLPFASGGGKEDFGNFSALTAPTSALLVPYSAFGILAKYAPTKNVELQLAAFDTEGDGSTVGIDSVLDGRTSYAATLRLTTTFFNKPGQHFFAATLASSRFFTMNDLIDINWGAVVARVRGVPSVAGYGPNIVGMNETSGSWLFAYAGGQNFYYDPDTDRWAAVFTKFSYADKDTNPVEASFAFGLYGKGLFPSRSSDEWGVAYFHADVNDDLPNRLRLGDEHGVELFYKFNLTPWLDITPSVQLIDPARQNADTLLATGLRMNIRF